MSELLLQSRTSHSLTFTWKRPEYYSGRIAALIKYRSFPDGDTKWQYYVIDSDDTVPSLTELTEFTSHSIEVAFIESDSICKCMCVFSEPFIAMTGKEGAYISLSWCVNIQDYI